MALSPESIEILERAVRHITWTTFAISAACVVFVAAGIWVAVAR